MRALKQRLLDIIAQDGPLTIAQYMAFCLHDPAHGYYSTRPALGADGDFITAPETSQMFGELIGLWCAQTYVELGSPPRCNLIELGPGSGVLMADAWRAMKALPAFRETAEIYLVEPSAPLRAAQKENLAKVGAEARWIEKLSDTPAAPSIIIANEYLDVLPIRQFIRTETDWRERLVGARDGELAYGFAPEAANGLVPNAFREAPIGSIAETRDALPAFILALAAKLKAAPGRALLIDYGTAQTTGGDTFQAVRAHRSANPLAEPGEADLTAHVDFQILGALAKSAGLDVAGPAPQGGFLRVLGIETRAKALQAAQGAKADVIERQMQRLIAPDQMGALFQAICISSHGLPKPIGFPP
ncbi:MAG: SAM-dependent methyltransferase, partial [Alphaproteobacteria bacterium]